jgi:hypothetical protein
MPVDSVDNYTVFRVIHSIAFRSSVFCSADKVREVVETRFFESYRQMFKTGFDISTSPDCQHSLLFFRAYPESYFAKTFFCRFLVLSIPGERWILQTVPGFSFQKLLRVYQHRSWGYLTTLSTIRSAISR